MTKPTNCGSDVPGRVGLRLHDVDERERARHQDHAEHAERERDLVGDELRAGAHRAEERELGVGRPAAEDEAVDAERADREDQEQRDREVGHVAVDLVAADLPARPPRDHRERAERRERGQERREDVEHVDRGGGEEALLADQLDEVGDRLQEPVGAGAVRAVAQLHPPHHLPLGERQVREADEDEVDDDERLDRGDPPGRAVRAGREEDVRQAHGFTTSTSRWRSAACSSGTRATPSTSFRLTRARSSTEVPFERTDDRVAGLDRAPRGIGRGELELGRRPLELRARRRARRTGPRRAAGSGSGGARR